MTAARTRTAGQPEAQTGLDRWLTRALDAVTASADGDGLVAVRPRDVAEALETSTVAVRGAVRRLVGLGRLVDVGRGALAVPGTRAATLSRGEGGDPPPRAPVHDAVHVGSGSTLLW